ncbi:hypothetical protein Glove_311g47 [Diversispora epigaea]|uniref:Uncharacterized protein n=1 Tax=Diversispora epigaea TaxID=1348612 RepID=A0A397HRD8_9GLOM|nr:hypothetical protein Glove_311g47 [Diversispora epigaea]
MLMEALWSLYFRRYSSVTVSSFGPGINTSQELIEQTSRMAQHGIKGLFVKYVFDNPVTAVKSSGATHGVVHWAEILGWLGGWYVGTKGVFGGALLPTTALDARGAYGGSRRGSESVSIKQRFGRSQLPVTLYEE